MYQVRLEKVFRNPLKVALQIFTYLTDRQNYSIYQVQYKLACLSVFSSAALTLEVFDFAPIMGHIDSHALWHAGKL